MTALFIIGLLLGVIALGVLIYGFAKGVGISILVGFIMGVVAAVLIFFSTWWTNGVGEAKVMVNSVDKQVVGTIEQPGSGFKPAWVDFVDFDLFSQELVFAGGGDQGAPSYTGGTVNGQEVTVSVGGVAGGSTQARVDMTFVYGVNADNVEDIYQEFRSQERFTEQIISRQVLSISRQIPSEYSAIEFRGAKRGEAELKIQEALNERLAQYGVEFSAVTIQDVRFDENVEAALTRIEEANQAAQTAEAEQRTAAVQNETKIAAAQAEADANRILTESLTPQVIEQRRIDALIEVSKGGNLIIDGGEGGVLLNRDAPAAQ
jgi:regulator of protease activity HflC (stomatin/prohibitin superfamily)